MNDNVRKWLERNNIKGIDIKKGSESVFKTEGSSHEDIAEQIAEIYEVLPNGTYKILGRTDSGTSWTNAQTLIFEKKNEAKNTIGNAMGKLYTEEELKDKLELQKRELYFEMLEKRVSVLEGKFDKVVSALKELSDDNEENDKSAIEKISEVATTAKNLFGDLKL